VHFRDRAGTGKLGASGIGFSFCDYGEKIALFDIQKLIRKKYRW